ncbi:MAG: ActS/PrrB/RegB family redox-sensitive histidine kinase [Robiginitomaculum sp.]
MASATEFQDKLKDDIYRTGRLRRSTLVSLRWLAVCGQCLSIFIIWAGFKFSMPYGPIFVIIGFSALMNILIHWRAPLDRRITNMEAGFQLFFDLLQLSALLYLTGGIKNPFALLLLAPVVVAAKTLSKTVFAVLAISAALLSLALLFFHMPLPWYKEQNLELPMVYLYGSWLALLVGMLFTSSYTWRATAQTRRMTEALAATDLILAQEQKLSALGGLAAAAAHKLGTPLGTIQIVAKEILNSAKDGSELKEDADLLLSQARRCRNILQELSSRGDHGDAVYNTLDLPTLLEEITKPFTDDTLSMQTNVIDDKGDGNVPSFKRLPELVYGLTNIVENATNFAQSEVIINARWINGSISIEVLDDGPGFSPFVLAHIGEPYISQRPKGPQKAGGMGLGVFIAKTLLERMGGRVVFENRKDKRGACVHLCWSYKDKKNA